MDELYLMDNIGKNLSSVLKCLLSGSSDQNMVKRECGLHTPECGAHTSNLGRRGNRDTSILTGVHKVQKVQRCTKYKIPNNLCCFISTIKSTMVAQNNKSTKVCKEKTLEKVVSRLFNSIV